MTSGIVFAPMLPLPWLAAALLVGLGLCGVAIVRRGRGAGLRVLSLILLALGVLDPRLVRETRTPSSDVALIVADHSPSQAISDRGRQRDDAVTELSERLHGMPDLDVRVIVAGDAKGDGATRAFAAAERAVSEFGANRLAAVFLVTDGQVHDAPAEGTPSWLPAPVHVLLTGAPGERDRRVVIEQAPAYGLVGTPVSLRYRIDDLGAQDPPVAGRVPVHFSVGGTMKGTALATPGRSEALSFTLDHAGPTAVEIEVEPLADEVATRNNRAAVVINGVRDRLRVLLVSGQPHLGERTWRNLLKSDPAVDLVHFTILRPPDKDEFTPLRELSLIVFPVQELFEKRLHDFDLIVFDRYGEHGVLIDTYYDAIARYVEQGGALLIASGTEYAGPMSLFHTGLRPVLPAVPTGRSIEKPFVPTVTELGHRHPMTAGLPAAGEASGTGWGPWFRLIEAGAERGRILMTGADGRPLLIVDRVGDGRIAQLMSDQVWLWARGYQGGGPYVELIRRMAHWLMKEPELEEDAIKATIADGRLSIERRSLEANSGPVRVTTPLGEGHDIALEDRGDGVAAASVDAAEPGLYRVEADGNTAVAVAGGLNVSEFADLRASDERLQAVAGASGGSVSWLKDGLPQIREVAKGRIAAGRGWMGLQRNHAFVVTGTSETPLLPGLLLVALALGSLMLAWWREGH